MSGLWRGVTPVRRSMAVRFSTAGVERRSQLDYWREAVCATFFALDVEREEHSSTGFRGQITAQSLDQVRIATVSSEPHAVIRSAERIRQSYGDDFVVNVTVRGRVVMTQQECETVVDPGDFAVYDSARPCRIACPDPFRLIVLTIPRDMFTSHCLLPRGMTTAVMRGDHGVGALFAPFVRSLTTQADTLPADVGQRVGANVVELLATALAEVTADSAPGVMPRAVHVLRAHRYIVDHLADPDLSPSGIARALRVSVRYLHLLFQAEGTSPARWILERRLERAGRLLTDPRQASRTVTDIAFSVGFKDASHFTRAFKNGQGLGPREYRRTYSGPPPTESPAP
jgi:AraC-like DNA-binding protein